MAKSLYIQCFGACILNCYKFSLNCLATMDEFLSRVPAVYREIYRQHWNTIKTSVKRGALRDVYHFPIAGYNGPSEYLNSVRAASGPRFKINVSFGFIIKNRLTEELRFFHPSNNTLLFDQPMLIANDDDFNNLLDRVERQDAFDYAREQRPSTEWLVERIVCVRFDVYRIIN